MFCRSEARSESGPLIDDVMYSTYILYSEKCKRTYVGYSVNVTKRLKEHNQGNTTSTKNIRPFILLFKEAFKTKTEAKKRERYWKSGAGRKKLKDYFNKKDRG